MEIKRGQNEVNHPAPFFLGNRLPSPAPGSGSLCAQQPFVWDKTKRQVSQRHCRRGRNSPGRQSAPWATHDEMIPSIRSPTGKLRREEKPAERHAQRELQGDGLGSKSDGGFQARRHGARATRKHSGQAVKSKGSRTTSRILIPGPAPQRMCLNW